MSGVYIRSGAPSITGRPGLAQRVRDEVGTEGGDWVHRMGLVVQFWGLREAGNMKMRSGRSTSAQRLGVSALHKGPVAEWRWCGESRGERVEGRGAHHAQPAP